MTWTPGPLWRGWLNYTTLKAKELVEQYQVRFCPTLIVIDQDGIVRDVITGHAATFKDDVARSVEALLKAKPGK